MKLERGMIECCSCGASYHEDHDWKETIDGDCICGNCQEEYPTYSTGNISRDVGHYADAEMKHGPIPFEISPIGFCPSKGVAVIRINRLCKSLLGKSPIEDGD